MIRLVRPVFVLAALCMALFGGVVRAQDSAQPKKQPTATEAVDCELERCWQPAGGDGGGLAGG